MWSQLNRSQLELVSDIFANAGQVFLGLLLAAFFSGFDKSRLDLLLSSLVMMFGCWIYGVYLRRKL